MVEKRTILLASAAVVPATLGIGLIYYLKKKSQRIITVQFDKTSTTGCTEDTQGVTITITDGLGKPLANKEFSIQIYVDGTPQLKQPYTAMTGPDGTARFQWREIGWATTSPRHIDADIAITESWVVTCDGYTGSASYTIVFKACTDFSLCCMVKVDTEERPYYFCYYTTCPSGTRPC